MNEQAHDLIESLKGKLPAKWGHPLLYGVFLVGTMVINYTAAHTHAADVQAEQEKRITALEADRATRVEVQAMASSFNDFKSDTRPRLERIENLLLKDLQFHQKH